MCVSKRDVPSDVLTMCSSSLMYNSPRSSPSSEAKTGPYRPSKETPLPSPGTVQSERFRLCLQDALNGFESYVKK